MMYEQLLRTKRGLPGKALTDPEIARAYKIEIETKQTLEKVNEILGGDDDSR